MTIFLYTITITITILLPVLLAVGLRRRVRAPWWTFCVGMATFVGSQVYHIPLNNWLTDLGVIGAVGPEAANLLRTAVILGLSAGVSETAARALGYGVLFRLGKAQRREDSLMVGLGHGGIEAILLGGVLVAASVTALWGLRGVDLTTMGMTAEQMTAVQFQLDALLGQPWGGVFPLFERIVALSAHVAVSVLTWQAFAKRQPLYAVGGALYHALLDTTAVYIAQQTSNVYLIEGALLLVALPAIVWLALLAQQLPAADAPAVASELRLFTVALRKELMQQWRTRRTLVIGAVFVLFGLIGPLTAKFTPEILRMVEEAQPFADLIPEPTIADSVLQYVSNVTQFGFIVAVLLGMGAIAGEKERGTAAMVLSKPLPRWAFVLSKFTAQAILFLGGFLLSGLTAYYYTLVLFAPLDFGAFMLGNGVLLLWLLVYTAVTTLGSAIANSTSMGAGIALAGAVLLLLLGAIPQIAGLAPGALVSWASQLGLEPVPFNGGAIAANASLILVLLITAVAVFEVQEL